MTTQIVQVGLAVHDLDRASAFYSDLLGLDPVARFDPPGLAFFDLGGVRLLLSAAGGPVAPEPTTFVYLRIDGIVATIDRLRRQGVVIASEPHVTFTHTDDTLGPAGTAEWQAFVRDTEGNLVCLVEHLPA